MTLIEIMKIHGNGLKLTRELIKEDQYVNISREHNWEHGVYECPVILKIKDSKMGINEIGIYLSNQLEVKVYYGEVQYNHGEYYYNKIQEWN